MPASPPVTVHVTSAPTAGGLSGMQASTGPTGPDGAGAAARTRTRPFHSPPPSSTNPVAKKPMFAVAPSATSWKALVPTEDGAFPSNVTDVRAELPKKASSPIDVTDFGITIDSKPEDSKARVPIVVNAEPASNVTDVRAELSKKASAPIDVTDFGISIDVKPEDVESIDTDCLQR